MEYKIKSTPNQIENFLKTIVFDDYIAELEIREKESFDMLLLPEQALNDPEHATEIITHDMVRGRIKNLKEMKNIFADIIGMSIEDLNRDKREVD